MYYKGILFFKENLIFYMTTKSKLFILAKLESYLIILHGDLKLANRLLHNGIIKIADFGFARLNFMNDFT